MVESLGRHSSVQKWTQYTWVVGPGLAQAARCGNTVFRCKDTRFNRSKCFHGPEPEVKTGTLLTLCRWDQKECMINPEHGCLDVSRRDPVLGQSQCAVKESDVVTYSCSQSALKASLGQAHNYQSWDSILPVAPKQKLTIHKFLEKITAAQAWPGMVSSQMPKSEVAFGRDSQTKYRSATPSLTLLLH